MRNNRHRIQYLILNCFKFIMKLIMKYQKVNLLRQLIHYLIFILRISNLDKYKKKILWIEINNKNNISKK
jgi:hypothetical protein